MRQHRLMYELLDMVVNAIYLHIREGQIAEDALKTIEKRKMFGRK